MQNKARERHYFPVSYRFDGSFCFILALADLTALSLMACASLKAQLSLDFVNIDAKKLAQTAVLR